MTRDTSSYVAQNPISVAPIEMSPEVGQTGALIFRASHNMLTFSLETLEALVVKNIPRQNALDDFVQTLAILTALHQHSEFVTHLLPNTQRDFESLIVSLWDTFAEAMLGYLLSDLMDLQLSRPISPSTPTIDIWIHDLNEEEWTILQKRNQELMEEPELFKSLLFIISTHLKTLRQASFHAEDMAPLFQELEGVQAYETHNLGDLINAIPELTGNELETILKNLASRQNLDVINDTRHRRYA